jgi:hypothetical protein
VALAGTGAVRPAIDALELYLTLVPEAANRDTVLEVLSDLRKRLN